LEFVPYFLIFLGLVALDLGMRAIVVVAHLNGEYAASFAKRVTAVKDLEIVTHFLHQAM
jgi:hypothetical protein